MTLLLAATLAVGTVALADEPVAYVNGEVITREELDRAGGVPEILLTLYQSFPAFAQSLLLTEEGKAFLARYEPDVLERLILRRIQLQEARRRGLTPDEDEVTRRTEDTLCQVCAHYGLTEEGFADYLQRQGTGLEEYRHAVARDHREDLLIALLKAALWAEISVSDEEIRAYYDADPGRFVDDDGDPLPLAEVHDRIAWLLRQEKEDAHWQAWLAQARREAEVLILLSPS